MMKKLFFLMVSLVFPYVVDAGTITFNFGGTPLTHTTTGTQDTYLAKLLVKENAARAVRVPPQGPITLEQFVRGILVEDLQERKRSADDFEKVDFCTSFFSKPVAEQNATKAQYGNNTPCP